MTFRHRAGVRPYTSPCGLAESCVFGKQSLGPLRCGRPGLRKQVPAPHGRRPFSLGYGAIMPSSLTTVPPIASVCSTRPPVSVLVRAPQGLPRGFSRQHGLAGFARSFVSRLGVWNGGRDFPRLPPYALSRGRPEPRPATPLRRPVGQTPLRRCGNVRPLRIGYACRPRLSSRLTLGGLASPRKP